MDKLFICILTYIHTDHELPYFQGYHFRDYFKNHEIHESFRLAIWYVIVYGSYTVQLYKYHGIHMDYLI